jgi:hypothetical protein
MCIASDPKPQSEASCPNIWTGAAKPSSSCEKGSEGVYKHSKQWKGAFLLFFGHSFTCRQRINAYSAAPRDLFSLKKTYHYTMICNICILSNWTQRFYMRARSVFILLAADSAVSLLEPAGGISAHVSSILAESLLLFRQMLGGPGPAPACPAPPHCTPSWYGSREFWIWAIPRIFVRNNDCT